jgi:tetratricopeptide repeat protein 8
MDDQPPHPHPGIDPTWLALSRLKRRRFTESIDLLSETLANNPLDQAAWYLKARALTAEAATDDTELEEEGVAEMLLDDNAIASMPRPGTSLSNPMATPNSSQSIRPVSSSGRPMTGMNRPGTNSGRPMSGMTVENAFKGNRPGTSRPVTTLGREVRLGTASMNASDSGVFIDVSKLNLAKYAKRPALAKILAEYLLIVECNPRKALELCAESTKHAAYKSWWWKSRLGKCYYKLSLYRDAEKQYRSALNDQTMLLTYFDLCKCYLKLDIPNTALDLLMKAGEAFRDESRVIAGMARMYGIVGFSTFASSSSSSSNTLPRTRSLQLIHTLAQLRHALGLGERVRGVPQGAPVRRVQRRGHGVPRRESLLRRRARGRPAVLQKAAADGH